VRSVLADQLAVLRYTLPNLAKALKLGVHAVPERVAIFNSVQSTGRQSRYIVQSTSGRHCLDDFSRRHLLSSENSHGEHGIVGAESPRKFLYQIGLRVFILARVVALIEQPNVFEAVPAPLTTEERVRLGQLIRTVERGLSQFLAVGAALLELRSSRLYRETHDTFESFCRETFGLARSTTDQVIRSATAAQLLIDNGVTLPPNTTEATIRPVASLPVALQPVSWQLVEAASSKAGPTSTVSSKICRTIRNAIEPPGAHTSRKPRKKEHTERETPFLRPVIRLTNWTGFSPELVTSHVVKLPGAWTTYEACGRMVERCELVRSALAQRFPELCQPTPH
jgi:hypothetical protein